MRKTDGSFTPAYPYVVHRDNPGEKIVPPASGKYLLDASTHFYNAATDDGKITCADCMLPDMRLQKGYAQAGRRTEVRTHFRTAHGHKHDPDCLALAGQAEPLPHTSEINLDKAPLIFLNGLPEVMSLTKRHYLATHPRPRLVVFDADGKIRINDDDLKDRRRLRASSPEDIFRIMKSRTMTQDQLRGAWIVENDRKTPWTDFFVHTGIAAKPDYSLMEKLVTTLASGPAGEHAVMLRAVLDQSPRPKRSADGKTRLRFPMGSFSMAHPETGDPLTVVPLLHVREKTLFRDFNGIGQGRHAHGGELFALTQPFLSRQRGRDDVVFLNFEINQADHYVWKSLAGLKAEIVRRPDFFTAPAAK